MKGYTIFVQIQPSASNKKCRFPLTKAHELWPGRRTLASHNICPYESWEDLYLFFNEMLTLSLFSAPLFLFLFTVIDDRAWDEVQNHYASSSLCCFQDGSCRKPVVQSYPCREKGVAHEPVLTINRKPAAFQDFCFIVLLWFMGLLFQNSAEGRNSLECFRKRVAAFLWCPVLCPGVGPSQERQLQKFKCAKKRRELSSCRLGIGLCFLEKTPPSPQLLS